MRKGCFIAVQDAGIIEHHPLSCQWDDAVPEPGDHLSIGEGDRLQVCDETPCIVFFVLGGWVDPDEAIVAQDHWGTARQVMEVGLLPFHQGGGDLNQNALT